MGLVCDEAVAIGALTAGYLLSAAGVVATRWSVLAVIVCAGTRFGGARAETSMRDGAEGFTSSR